MKKKNIRIIFRLIFIVFSFYFLEGVFAQVLPEIPTGELKASKAMFIREELELTKKDIEQKLIQLKDAKNSYDKSKSEFEVELKNIQEERKLLDDTLQQEKQIKEERIKSTVEFMIKMDPKKVAFLMENMDRDLVIVLLSKLPQRQVTKILESMLPAKATQYLEYYTRIRSGREFEMLKDLGVCSPRSSNEDKNGKP